MSHLYNFSANLSQVHVLNERHALSAGFAAPAAAAGSAEAPIVASGTRASIVTVTGGACAAAAENGVATSTVNGAAAVPAQAFPQGSFQPNVTYTLAAPGMTPMPG